MSSVKEKIDPKDPKNATEFVAPIDLSKIKNMEAVEATDAKMASVLENKISDSKNRKNLKKRYCFIEPEAILLPSHGKFYQDSEDEDLRNGYIKMYPMSVSEEEILSNKSYIKNGSILRLLFESCMASNYDASKLLSFDATYLLYTLRKLSYGDDYTFETECTDQKCNKKIKKTINISEIDFEELPENTKEQYEIYLPCSKYTVTMVLPRLKHDEKATKNKIENDDIPENAIDNASHTISVKDKNGKELSPAEWFSFFSALPSMDRVEIDKTFKFTMNSPKVKVVCPKCGNAFEVSVPMDADFFRL